ncbi:biotin--[acetyl-CoA-carboxylase] ligase [Flavobacterium crassostreae]|uniref:Biotin--[acetyl-CoA-carboxylase] ligase n=1 Tax=Flavobacterium crassostreae TaxID=1763534 RepID=A0A1B9E9Q6_9FLAO|nr:biotin--[acetyl-CoA-carboxylase] ligase [Flavobacterium crassostreae]OCB78672.1 biotin--[acetyl-CoA-carboxylase] ligase [Flavobacterium crassostreae]
MKLIKLDAIDSTNDFLKEMAKQQPLENFTVVTAQTQTKGRGQMGTTWSSEPGKNLIMSIFVKNDLADLNQIYTLNIAVALAVVQALKTFNIPQLSIKWPNDIMSDRYKIGGILIENTFKNQDSVRSIIGIGLNVNQINFDALPKGASLAGLCNQEFDIDQILLEIVSQLKHTLGLLHNQPESLWHAYRQLLFKKAVPMPFKAASGVPFMGIIQGVSPAGKLQVVLEDDSVSEFHIKEIQMLY